MMSREIRNFEAFVQQEFDNMEDFRMPTHKVVCWRCHGEGTHVNPAIDGNGITQADREDWADDDFMEDYLRGVYDVRCEECGGANVIDEVDERALNRQNPAIYKAWLDWCREMAELAAAEAAERRMGA